MDDVITRLQEISTLPDTPEGLAAWLKLQDAVAFLSANRDDDDLVLYAGLKYLFVHAIAVPAISVTPPDIDDLMKWNCNACSSWGMTIRYAEPPSVWLSPPLEHTGSQTLNVGEQFVFSRFFEGRLNRKSYVEILQKFTHALGLHYLPERSAYCRLDQHGDLDDIIRIVTVAERGGDFGGTIVTCRREVLDEYLALTDSAVVQTFDVTRYQPARFDGWQSGRTRQLSGDNLFWDWHIEPGHASFMRGCQIIFPIVTKQALIERSTAPRDKDKQYASFLAWDWKSRVLKEVSCAPEATANYFTESDLPFDTTPGFFRPDVLLKYKADPDKYRMTERSISCRGAWHLQTFDINEAGQVHTYLCYLRDLPYQEQLYWKSYNERPKSPISERAFKTDFEGTWHLNYNPLESLKDVLQTLNRDQVPWWTLRSERVLEQVQYPATASADEWGNEILLLDQLVVEGFEKRWLRGKAQSLGRPIDPSMGSLKAAEEVLIGLGVVDAQSTTAPLRELHSLRSKVKGHASGSEAVAIKQQVLATAGTFRNHFQSLCERCDEAMRAIMQILK